MEKKKRKILIIFLVVFALFITLIVGYSFWNNRKPLTKITPEKPPENSSFIDLKLFEENIPKIRNLISELFSEDLTYQVSDQGISSFGKELNLSDDRAVYIGISSYIYQIGMKQKVYYEEIENTIDYDDKIKVFESLKPGKQVVLLDIWLGKGPVEIDYRKIGGKYFAVYDNQLYPPGSWQRIYAFYDKATKKYRSFVFGFSTRNDKKAVKYSSGNDSGVVYYKDVVYPDDIEKAIAIFENLLSEQSK